MIKNSAGIEPHWTDAYVYWREDKRVQKMKQLRAKARCIPIQFEPAVQFLCQAAYETGLETGWEDGFERGGF